MTGITLAEAQRQLDLWLQASAALANGRQFTIESRQLTLNDAKSVRDMVSFYERRVSMLSGERLYAGDGGHGGSLPVPPGVSGETPS